MRPLATLMLVALIPALVRPFLPLRRRPRWLDFLPLAAAGLLVLHVLLDEEPARIRMFPAYLLVALVLVFTLPRLLRPRPETRRRALPVVGGVLGLLLLALAVALPAFVLPFRAVPGPSGPFAVGTVAYDWTDAARPEAFTADPNDQRQIAVQFWYPAGKAAGKPTLAAPGAPVAAAQPSYPVLVFSHGANGMRKSNESTFLELASHGYIVASIDHTYHALFTRFANGRTVPISMQYLQELQKEQAGSFPPEEDRRIAQGWLSLRTADMSFVLDQIEALNRSTAGDALAGRLDLDRVGLFGHSLGGGAAAEVCRQDPRVKAAIDIDGTMLGDITSVAADGQFTLTEAKFPRPLMILCNGVLYGDPRVRETGYLPNTTAYERTDQPAYLVVIAGAGHLNLTDLPFISPPLARSMGLGPIDPERSIRIVNSYVLAFFDRHLKGLPAPLLDGPSPDYPEVTFEARNDA